ncbi:VanZ family protein [Neobacillus niacini]|uniref:VanZ family protein n=1 Tax=Neobacillus niacini TaxID=86668 RepID=UPI0021CB6B2B|nr:VanZ family protein [Neobacillus niacini]MCM3763562.1 VanZ family protein [Neobacillus niacini]
MRWLLVLVWAGAIFVLTCNASFRGLVESGMVRFEWDPQPMFGQLLDPLPERMSSDFLMQKLGHITAFFILTALLQTKLQSNKVILLVAISYAILTELLQLYFARDGRLFDVGFDTVGALLALAAESLFTKLGARQSIQK